MFKLKGALLVVGLLGVAIGPGAAPAEAASVTKTYVGTLPNPLTAFGADPANNPGDVARGNKYVIRTTFETGDGAAVAASGRLFQTRDFWSISLDDAPGGANTFELFIPSEGFGGVLTQTGQDHFAISPGTAQTAEIHFFNPCTSAATCATQFRGFEFESNFVVANDPNVPAAGGDIIFELRDTDSNLSSTTVTNQVVNVLDGDPGFLLQTIMANGGTGDVRSESDSPSGGQQNPGVFLSEAVEVIAEAGANPLVYSAGALSVTTDGGTERVTEAAAPIVPGQIRSSPSSFDDQPRQADNDLGAGRSDGEDFLAYQWTVGGANVNGNQDGTRINRDVETLTPGGKSFVNDGIRTVENVNITATLAQSGLQNTTDTKTFDVRVTEAITGLSDTDSVSVSYANAGPSAAAGPGVVFDASNFNSTLDATGSADDPDLAANAQVAGFETLAAQFSIGGTALSAGESLGSPAAGPVPISQNVVTLLDAFNLGGLNMTTATTPLDLKVTDFAGATATASQNISYANALLEIATASATPVGPGGLDLRFDLVVTDADLAVNVLIPDFEVLVDLIFVDSVDRTSFFSTLIGADGTGGSQVVSNGDLLSDFGLGLHTFEVQVSDKTLLATMGTPVTASFNFNVVPAPGTLSLLGSGLAGLAAYARRRSKRA